MKSARSLPDPVPQVEAQAETSVSTCKTFFDQNRCVVEGERIPRGGFPVLLGNRSGVASLPARGRCLQHCSHVPSRSFALGAISAATSSC